MDRRRSGGERGGMGERKVEEIPREDLKVVNSGEERQKVDWIRLLQTGAASTHVVVT